jgi:hypothetical protein
MLQNMSFSFSYLVDMVTPPATISMAVVVAGGTISKTAWQVDYPIPWIIPPIEIVCSELIREAAVNVDLRSYSGHT